MITAVILSLYQLREEATATGLFEKLRVLGMPEESGLSAMASLTLGLPLVERATAEEGTTHQGGGSGASS